MLGTATLVWGALTGTWFGSDWILANTPLKALVLPQLTNFPELFGGEGSTDPETTVKWFCFIIGTIQLSLAHLKNFLRRMPSLEAFSQLGWLSMVVGLYHLVLVLVLGMGEMPVYAFYMVGIGLGMVFVFSEQRPGQNFFIGALKGLAGFLTTFLSSISAFSDIISYIRLFAVGLATVAIARSFNTMAAPMLGATPAVVGAVIILVLGHGLNMIMAALSVVVHGVRLNMLEFSGHLGMEWTGEKYDPFRVRETAAGNENNASQVKEGE